MTSGEVVLLPSGGDRGYLVPIEPPTVPPGKTCSVTGVPSPGPSLWSALPGFGAKGSEMLWSHTASQDAPGPPPPTPQQVLSPLGKHDQLQHTSFHQKL